MTEQQIDQHLIYLVALGFVGLVALLLAILVIDDGIRRRRKRKALAADAAEAERRRQRGLDEGFRKGYHG